MVYMMLESTVHLKLSFDVHISLLQEMKKTKILLGKAGHIKEEGEEEEVVVLVQVFKFTTFDHFILC